MRHRSVIQIAIYIIISVSSYTCAAHDTFIDKQRTRNLERRVEELQIMYEDLEHRLYIMRKILRGTANEIVKYHGKKGEWYGND